MAHVVFDFAYLKMSGEWIGPGEPPPSAAGLFATTLFVSDLDTKYLMAISRESKQVSRYAISSVVGFIHMLNIRQSVLRRGGEAAATTIAKAAKSERKQVTTLQGGSLKDSANIGAIEGPSASGRQRSGRSGSTPSGGTGSRSPPAILCGAG